MLTNIFDRFLEDNHTFMFLLIKYIISLTFILTLFSIEVVTFCYIALSCTLSDYTIAQYIYLGMMVFAWLEINVIFYL